MFSVAVAVAVPFAAGVPSARAVPFAVDVPPPDIASPASWDKVYFSHGLWDAVLSAHVDEQGLVDYSAVGRDDRFRQYLYRLAETDPAGLASAADRKAFWINAYNALAMYGALRVMPDDPQARAQYSVLSFVLPGFEKGKSFFAGQRFLVGGQRYSLDDIEKRVLLRRWDGVATPRVQAYRAVAPEHGDPRIHFALVCCARGCPVLSGEAYVGGRVEQQLEQAARRFFNDSGRSRFDIGDRQWRVSQLLDWYQGDFTNQEFTPHAKSLAALAARYVDDTRVAGSLRSSNWRITYEPYDWRLNIQQPVAP